MKSNLNHQIGLWHEHGSPPYDEEGLLNRAIQILESRLIKGEQLTSATATKRYCQLQIADDPEECFCCLYLTTQHTLIKFERLFQGTIDGASVHPRVVIKKALELNAAAVIFTHNHPSGVAEPSQADISITKKLKEAFSYIDVRVLDHIVVSNGGTVSLAESGLI